MIAKLVFERRRNPLVINHIIFLLFSGKFVMLKF